MGVARHPPLFLLHKTRFNFCDLFDTACVSAPFECGVQPNFDHPIDEPVAQQIARQAENVGIVVQPAHLGGQLVVTRCSTHAGKLVGRYTHTGGGAADENAAIDFAVADSVGDDFCEVGIIDAIGVLRAEVDALVAEVFEQ